MVTNKAASIRQKLRSIARERQETFDFVLRQYALQCLMYRLSISEHNDQFMLKGGLLFWVWSGDFHRPTQDMDLLGFGKVDIEHIQQAFTEIINIDCDDGLVFDTASLKAKDIKEEAQYQGVRVTGRSSLERAQIVFQIDIGFGDAVAKVNEVTEIPVFIDDMPKPKLKTYPAETVVAEKFQAMVELGIANSRMKDFFDIYTISEIMGLNRSALQHAILATFERRDTALDIENIYVFSDEFKNDDGKSKQWSAFVRKNQLSLVLSFKDVVEHIEAYLLDALRAQA